VIILELNKQYTTFEKDSNEVKFMIHRVSQRLAEIESFMWNLLNSDEDIPKDEKLWMKTKLAGKDGEFISNFREMSKSMEEDCASELEEMGIEVPKDFEPERNKLGQSSRSEAFNNEEYELIEDEKEKCMFRRRKKEEYL
ncbi:hypothetical protein MKW94_007296, partial [Papaver nudicaule]|nr:hypothetical protein [Papaver nudicaule]